MDLQLTGDAFSVEFELKMPPDALEAAAFSSDMDEEEREDLAYMTEEEVLFYE